MPTIKDIAKKAGVSNATVSRALRDSPLIKDETKLKVRKIADELGYSPNLSAIGLVNQKSYLIGLFFSDVAEGSSTENLIAESIRGISSVLPERYTLSVESIKRVRNLKTFTPKRYAGILVAGQSDDDDEFIEFLKSNNIPVIVLVRPIEDFELLNVISNDFIGVKDAVNETVKLGHFRFAYIEGQSNMRSSLIRKNGFLAGLKEHNISIDTTYFYQGDYSIESGRRATETLLKEHADNLPSVIFAANDDMAIGVLNACYENFIRIPEEISVVGFDDISFAQYTTPPLSTVRKPIYSIAQSGTSALLNHIENESAIRGSLFIDTKFMHRGSLAQYKNSTKRDQLR